MGMFDDIRVETLLPDNPDNDTIFQTKSFDSFMEQYVISEKGELYKEEWDTEWIDEETHWFGGYIHRIPETYRRSYLTDYHGDVIFYNGRKSDDSWKEYIARFTNGKLTQISTRYVKY